ncbi:hypothetical protein KAH94_03140 [bacterium]|nr:hypothetical protein [bacterium]
MKKNSKKLQKCILGVLLSVYSYQITASDTICLKKCGKKKYSFLKKSLKALPINLIDKFFFDIAEKLSPLKIAKATDGSYKKASGIDDFTAVYEPLLRLIIINNEPKSTYHNCTPALKNFVLMHERAHSTQLLISLNYLLDYLSDLTFLQSIKSTCLQPIVNIISKAIQTQTPLLEFDANKKTMYGFSSLNPNKASKENKEILSDTLKNYFHDLDIACLSGIKKLLYFKLYHEGVINTYIQIMNENKNNQKGIELQVFFDKTLKHLNKEKAKIIRTWKIKTPKQYYKEGEKIYKDFLDGKIDQKIKVFFEKKAEKLFVKAQQNPIHSLKSFFNKKFQKKIAIQSEKVMPINHWKEYKIKYFFPKVAKLQNKYIKKHANIMLDHFIY